MNHVVCHMIVEYAKLSTSTASAAEVVAPAQVSPCVLMPAAAAGSFVLTVDQQQAKDIGCVALPPAVQPQCAASMSSSTSSQQLSSVLSPAVGQLLLCPAPTVPSQFAAAPLTVAAAGPTSSSAQFCTMLGPMTSVSLLRVPTVVQVQVVPAAVGMPVNPVIVAGNVSGASSLFMVPN